MLPLLTLAYTFVEMDCFMERFASLPAEMQREIMDYLLPYKMFEKIKFKKYIGNTYDSNYSHKYQVGYDGQIRVQNEKKLFISRIPKLNLKRSRYYITEESIVCTHPMCSRKGKNGQAKYCDIDICGEPDKKFKSKAVGGKLSYALYQLIH